MNTKNFVRIDGGALIGAAVVVVVRLKANWTFFQSPNERRWWLAVRLNKSRIDIIDVLDQKKTWYFYICRRSKWQNEVKNGQKISET